MSEKNDMNIINDTKVVVPPKRKNFVPFGYYNDLKKIMETRQFFPIYLYGPSGVGKTSFVYQVCAELQLPMVRFNFTEGTTEDHLFGGFRLFKGETKFFKGPVITAMETGSVLLLDEGDQASPTVSMALQAILEGNSYIIKQTGEEIIAKPGFNIILAANTKGRGDDTGTFIGAQIQNEANLDRYNITFEHTYPPEKQEIEIIKKELNLKGIDETQEFHDLLVKTMVTWANDIRKVSQASSVSETMSTRRLVHYVQSYAIFQHKHKTLDLILARFDHQTALAWKDLFSKIDTLPSKVNTVAEYEKWKAEQEEIKKSQKSGLSDKEEEWQKKFLDLQMGKEGENAKPF